MIDRNREKLIRQHAAHCYRDAVELQEVGFIDLRTPPRDIVRCPPAQLFGDLRHPDTDAVTRLGWNAARAWGRWEGVDWA